MDHRINELSNLYDNSVALYNDAVKNKADSIIDNLERTIGILKNSWKGKDAGVQINNVVRVYNEMVKIRNALASVSQKASTVASDYYDIIRCNGAATPVDTSPIKVEEVKQEMAAYEDNRDTIDITTEVVNGKALLDSVIDQYDNFTSKAAQYYDQVMAEWLQGPGREETSGEIETFRASANNYKKLLSDASESITTAVKNYKM